MTYTECSLKTLACPGAPRVEMLPLEGAGTPHISSVTLSDLYPLALWDISISVSRRLDLEGLLLKAPVHVHTPTAHIGFICGEFTGQHIDVRDAILALQASLRHPSVPRRSTRRIHSFAKTAFQSNHLQVSHQFSDIK
ncbi:hypothetical protein NP233_g10808 [Leucocoprinus birnbaumii]|uniref:Uncharacterized protein n=1 Tax=Leucocoprinus birnbaumii TaxID=56174 RepID=A0AAD5YLU4_9AGAR|nr:hypothetical protein NP233_g10808 [Leucocoprinus birnbaumii]